VDNNLGLGCVNSCPLQNVSVSVPGCFFQTGTFICYVIAITFTHCAVTSAWLLLSWLLLPWPPVQRNADVAVVIGMELGVRGLIRVALARTMVGTALAAAFLAWIVRKRMEKADSHPFRTCIGEERLGTKTVAVVELDREVGPGMILVGLG